MVIAMTIIIDSYLEVKEDPDKALATLRRLALVELTSRINTLNEVMMLLVSLQLKGKKLGDAINLIYNKIELDEQKLHEFYSDNE